MDKRQQLKEKMHLLQQMTVANGASPNEQEIARKKIKELSEKLFAIPLVEREIFPEAEFKMQFEELARKNRRKWGVK